MRIELIVLGIMCVIFVFYMLFVPKRRKTLKKKQSWFKRKKSVKSINDGQYEKNEVAHVAMTGGVTPKLDKSISRIKSNQGYWYQITVLISGEEDKINDFYSNDSEVTREQLLDEFYYPNDREILIKSENGDRYLNRNKVDEIQFIGRKILGNEGMVSETVISETLSGSEDVAPTGIKKDEKPRVESAVESVMGEETFLDRDKQALNNSKEAGRFLRKKKTKSVEVKRLSAKKVNFLAAAFVVVVAVSGILGLVRTYGVGSRVNEVEAQVTDIKKGSQLTEDELGFNPYLLNQFMQSFITRYMTLSNDPDGMKERKLELVDYFANNVKIDDLTNLSIRELTDSELFNIVPHEKYETAQYKVTYQVETIKEETDPKLDLIVDNVKKEEENLVVMTQKTILLNLDFITNETGFSLISNPYMTEFDDYSVVSDGLVKDGDALEKVAEAEKVKVSDFLTIFFGKYAEGSTEELSYMIEKVESLGGGYEFKAVKELEVVKQGDRTVAFVTAEFLELGTNLIHKEEFSLKLKNNKEQLVIEKLTHNLGGF